MTLETLALVAAQAAAALAVAWACGVLVIDRIGPRLATRGLQAFGTPEKALVSAGAFGAFCIALMLVHIVTGGAVFALPAAVPLIAVAVVAAAVSRRRPRGTVGRRHLPVAALALALVVVFVLPVIVTGSGVRAGDPPWHLGWTEQLLAGEPVPTGPAPEFGRNAYPWGFHALLATMVRLAPGSDPVIAHETMHLFLVGLIPLAAACLARLVNRRAGVAAAWAASLVGGFGWVTAGRFAFVASPSEARYGADLVVASPNSMYELFPPALPREVALVALAGAALLLVPALQGNDRRLQIVAGMAMGAVGLISVPMLLSALAWSAMACAFVIDRGRLLAFATLAGSAVVVFALWAGPVAAGYLAYDGFVDITPRLGVEWELGVALASWGMLLPLAAGGVALLVAQLPIVGRPVLAYVAGSVVLLALAVARGHLDWGVFANETLLHQGRMWPPLHLLGAACGGLAAVAAYGWLRTHARMLAPAVAVVIVVAGAASPMVAAAGLTEIMRNHVKGFVYAEPDLVRGSFVRRAAAHLGPGDVVEVQGSDELAFLLFQFSGMKLATYDDPRLDGNELRIRYAALARRWDERHLGDGFAADFVVRPVAAAVPEHPLARGRFDGERWEMVAVDD